MAKTIKQLWKGGRAIGISKLELATNLIAMPIISGMIPLAP